MSEQIHDSAFLDAAGKAAAIIQVRRETALLKTSALQNAIFNSPNFSCIATDVKGVIQLFNVGAERMLGYAATDVLDNLTPADISDPQEMSVRADALSVEFAMPVAPGFDALVFKASRGIKDIYELTKIRKDGNRFPMTMSVTALRDAYDAIIGYLLIGIPNTARQQAEEDRNRFFALSQDVFCTLGFDGYFKDLNPAWEKTLGYTKAELLAKSYIEFIHPDDGQRTLAEAEKLSSGNSPSSGNSRFAFENRYRCNDGSYRWFQWNATAVIEDRLIYGVARDVTERKRFEQTLQEKNIELENANAALQRSNAELEQFAYVASHDLQEPLRKVIGYTNLLAKRYQDKLDADANEFLGFTVDGATRMQQLIQDLLVYSRVGRQDQAFDAVNCADVLTQVLRDLQVAIDESGAVVTHDPLPTVLADGRQIAQLLQNLVSNAIKFRGKQPPRIHITATRSTSSPAFNGASPAEWVFAVRDQGIGLDPQYADRIFRIFQRLHSREAYPGTGIGLAICQKILDHHGGRLWVESQPGHGATFYFTLLERSRC